MSIPGLNVYAGKLLTVSTMPKSVYKCIKQKHYLIYFKQSEHICEIIYKINCATNIHFHLSKIELSTKKLS